MAIYCEDAYESSGLIHFHDLPSNYILVLLVETIIR
jgi:hypothetical protein